MTRMSKFDSVNITYECKECGRNNTVTVWPYIPAKTYGPPEDCYPSEGGYIEPTECHCCGEKISVDDCFDQVADDREAFLESKAAEEWDRRHEDSD